MEEVFNKASSHYIAKLKAYLRSHGVYVEMTRVMKMAKGLYNVAHEGEQAIWPQDELKKQIEASPFHSILTSRATIPAPRPALKIPFDAMRSDTSASCTPTPAPQPQPEWHVFIQPSLRASEAPSALSGLSCEVANLAKLYTEEQKYSGESDNFEYKLNIFNNACKRADLPVGGKANAFPTMLKGLALDFFFSTLNNCNLNFDQICRAISAHFEGKEYQ